MRTEWEILDYIDRGSWKHSWHLKKDQYGYVDWSDPATLKEVRAILLSFKAEGQRMIESSERYLAVLKSIGPKNDP